MSIFQCISDLHCKAKKANRAYALPSGIKKQIIRIFVNRANHFIMKKILPLLFCCLTAALFVACKPKEIIVSSITLNPDKVTLTEGETTTVVATVLPADATDPSLTWSSSNTAAATVDQDGVVTAVKEGTATVTAKITAKNSSVIAASAPSMTRQRYTAGQTFPLLKEFLLMITRISI